MIVLVGTVFLFTLVCSQSDARLSVLSHSLIGWKIVVILHGKVVLYEKQTTPDHPYVALEDPLFAYY